MERYHQINGCFPDKIYIYRDGCSDGDFEKVREFEIPQIKGAFEDLRTEPK